MNRLTPADLNYVPETSYLVDSSFPEFDQLTGEENGFDTDLLVLGSAIASEPDDGSAFDTLLGDLAFNPGDFQASTYDPINTDWGNFQPAYESALVDNESGLGGDPSPSGGAPQPTPPPGGGSGGAGGYQGGGAGSCVAADFPGVQCDQITYLGAYKVGSGGQQTIFHLPYQLDTVWLPNGSQAVFSAGLIQVAGFSPNDTSHCFVQVNTSAAGHFSTVLYIQPKGGKTIIHYCLCTDVS
jgi:hypothetical protein